MKILYLLLFFPVFYFVAELSYQLCGSISTNWFLLLNQRGGLVSIASLFVFFKISPNIESSILSFLFILIGVFYFSIDIFFINSPLEKYLEGLGTNIYSKKILIVVSVVCLTLIGYRFIKNGKNS